MNNEKTIQECEVELRDSRRRISGAVKQLESRMVFSGQKYIQAPQVASQSYAFCLECVALGFYVGQLVVANQNKL